MNYGFLQLKDLLPKAVGSYGMTREVRAALVRDRARKAVRNLWGDDITEIKPMFFKDGILMIECSDSAWGQEVFMKKQKLIELIEENVTLKGSVKDVKTRIKG
ncbi:MAG: hypothetical protein ACD_51C00101G0006 [uncultured bacterium]|nr:MAG: hypothetical protein ACD_51C00101G0006 [uncultured bacterium]OGJ48208.1 MAG: hypothetical protein A2344_01230 [Candidatus Peregrinibacteria bacterium RIFOXYB12_FULL_41_12]OGJ48320.1 MAG: hypothetical protein A2244_02285 [Candidatus Peregrinibacteria bacterium RIFOXYA2_FULL_41_18]OGJ53325.1 MAG: hypothetical protein A2448_03015 [Candidatus Peregrinibacteria bacterium RIFOXYC2_FULL_41_22]OGJ54286.1 MAG: hypothetical protein A2336_03965 [Candidatus Peregrinibacteria bacterium RIFOXYB2_FULL